jgi:hypothetical protein
MWLDADELAARIALYGARSGSVTAAAPIAPPSSCFVYEHSDVPAGHTLRQWRRDGSIPAPDPSPNSVPPRADPGATVAPQRSRRLIPHAPAASSSAAGVDGATPGGTDA